MGVCVCSFHLSLWCVSPKCLVFERLTIRSKRVCCKIVEYKIVYLEITGIRHTFKTVYFAYFSDLYTFA